MSWQSPSVEPGASQHDAETGTPRKGPRWRLIIRLLIYIPVLGFVTWQAGQRFIEERRAVDDGFRSSVDSFRASVNQTLQHPPRMIVMPNGETMPVLELTEEEAVEMGILPTPSEASSPASAPASP